MTTDPSETLKTAPIRQMAQDYAGTCPVCGKDVDALSTMFHPGEGCADEPDDDDTEASNSASIRRMEPKSNWLVLWNMPGYMPDMEPYVLDSWESARDSLIDELERELDSIDEELSEEHAVVVAIEELRALAPFAEWSGYVGSYFYLLEATDEPTDDEREARDDDTEQGWTPSPDSGREQWGQG